MPFFSSNKLRSGFFNVVATAGYDTDAQAYFDAIVANSGTIGTSAKSAVDTFVKGLKADGLWSLIYELGLFAGVDQLAAALVKVKTPLSSRLLTNVNFASGDYVATGSTAGLKGNGTTKYLNTGFNAGSSGTTPQSCSSSSFGLWAYYNGTETTGTSRIVAASQDGSSSSLTALGWVVSGSKESGGVACGFTTEYPAGSSTSTFGFTGVNSSGSRSIQWWKNGAAVGATGTGTANFANVPIYLFCSNVNNASQSNFSTRYVRGYSVTQGLNSTQAANFASRWNTLMTAFSANTY